MKLRNLILKDLSVMLSDKQAFIIILLMPMILMMILGLALGPAFSSNGFKEPIKIAIVKEYDRENDITIFKSLLQNNIQDDDEVNIQAVIEEIEAIDIEKIFFHDFLENDDLQQLISYQILDRREAEEKLNTGNIAAIVVLPEGLIHDMYINFVTPFKTEIQIEIIQHPNNMIRGNVVESIMKGFFDQISSIIISKNVFIETAIEEGAGFEIFDELEMLLRETSEDFAREKVTIEPMTIDNHRRINSFDYYAAAMLSMFSLYLATIKSRSLFEESNLKTLQRMKASGISIQSIILSKYITAFIFSLVQIISMMIYSTLVMKVDWGSYSSAAILMIPHALAVAALSVFIGAIILKLKQPRIANLFESALIPLMAFIGGNFIHYSILPGFIQKLSYFTINGLTLRGYTYIMLGYGIKDILNYIIGLVLMAAILTAIGIIILLRRGEGTDVNNFEIKNIEIKR